jgi:hypothetical protein
MTEMGCGDEDKTRRMMLKRKFAEDAGSEGSRPVNKKKILVIPDVLYRESILVFKDGYPPTTAGMTRR